MNDSCSHTTADTKRFEELDRLSEDITIVEDIIEKMKGLHPCYKKKLFALHHVVLVAKKQIPKKPKKEIWVVDEKRKGDVRLARENDILTKDNHTTINLCPNCGEVKKVELVKCCGTWSVICVRCGSSSNKFDKPQQAIKKWNRRAGDVSRGVCA